MTNFTISGNIVDAYTKSIYKGVVVIKNGTITHIERREVPESVFILPGFIDAHVHIESSMLPPSEFARLAVVHGTVSTVSDPHEIANVIGMAGIDFMIENGNTVPFKFNFGAPSCVPATKFENAGAEITSSDVDRLLQRNDIKYLAEMMNWPGVLYGDKEVTEKIEIAKKYNKVIDGHAPGLTGDQAITYASAGISTDHECFSKEEALQKINLGMKILIREGSAAKNFDTLIGLLNDHEDSIMFCSDDKHPDNLVEGHINTLVKRALNYNIDLFKILKAACINPIRHYGLLVGSLKVEEPADFIVVNNLSSFEILKTYINGVLVAENGISLIKRSNVLPVNHFSVSIKKEEEFAIQGWPNEIRIIKVLEGQLITESIMEQIVVDYGFMHSNPEKDILKIVVVNRYKNVPPAIAFINGFGLQQGALASSIAHDSHNIITVGVDDFSIKEAVNEIISNKGGLSAFYEKQIYSLPLPIAGLMSVDDGYEVARKYTTLDLIAKEMGSKLLSPYMSLSFMALLVIPSLKISDLGLFDSDKFQFVKN